MNGTLYIVATPIGNLEDMTLRAVRMLKEADAIACEDTRVTAKLLARYAIAKPLLALHEHSNRGQMERVIQTLQEGKTVAYVSDAGTPGVNDPGGKLVQVAVEKGIPVVPIPGASAVTAAISVCGFAMDEFHYAGFIPHKKGRKTLFTEIAAREVPTIFFESTHRILKTLEELRGALASDRRIFVGRELTKQFETLYRGTVDEVRVALQDTSIKGEFVVIVGPTV